MLGKIPTWEEARAAVDSSSLMLLAVARGRGD